MLNTAAARPKLLPRTSRRGREVHAAGFCDDVSHLGNFRKQISLWTLGSKRHIRACISLNISWVGGFPAKMSFIFVAEGGLGKGTRNKEYRDTCRINSWKETYPENWEWFWMCLMEVLFSSRRSRTIYYLKEGRTYDILISLTGEGLLCTCDIKTSICNMYHIYVYIYMIYDICITCIYIQHFGLSSIPMIDTCCVFCMFWCWHSHSASKLTAGVARKPCQECRGEAKREAMMEVWGGGETPKCSHGDWNM